MSPTEVSWAEARRIAATAALPLPVTALPLGQAHGLALGEALTALVDLPPFATAAMDGWAVAGPGPWRVTGRVLAGQFSEHLEDGEAVEIATGARLPHSASAVLRRERGRISETGRLVVSNAGDSHAAATASSTSTTASPDPRSSARPDSRSRSEGRSSTGNSPGTGDPASHHTSYDLAIGTDIRPQGQESRRGETLLPPGTHVTPAVLGLAAAAGYDTLPVHERPRAALIIIGDELTTSGLPDGSHVRDALGPMLTAWLQVLHVEATVTRIPDDADAVLAAIASSPADLVITTGGTARGPVDHVHAVLDKLGARLLIDGVAVRPGHPMLLATHGGTRQHRRFLAGLPGNPLAAVAGFVTLVRPLLQQLSGRTNEHDPLSASRFLPIRDAVTGHPSDTRLVPVSIVKGVAVPLRFAGPAMLRGLARADGLAVIPPHSGVAQGRWVEVLPT